MELDDVADPPRRIRRRRPGSVDHARIIAVRVYTSASDEPGCLRSRESAAGGSRARLLGHPALGRLAPGQLLGAQVNYVRLQDEYDAIYGIVDMHALTTVHDAESRRS